MLGLLAVGTFWFWIWVAVVGVWSVVSVANEWPGRATFGLIAFLLGIHLLGDVNLLVWIAAHIPQTLALVGCYLAIGSVWSVGKWFFYMKRIARAYADERIEFLKSRLPAGTDVDEKTQVPESLRDRWQTTAIHVGSQTYYPKDLAKIDLRKHKGRIMLWIGYWPFSALWTLVDDPLRALIREIYEQLSGLFSAIAARITGKLGVATDITMPPPPDHPSTGTFQSIVGDNNVQAGGNIYRGRGQSAK